MKGVKRPRITVVGSLNMDFVVTTPRVPLPGETVLGTRFSTIPGGKGNNQAIACARLGAEVTFIGCVGDDTFGHQLINNLNNENIHTQHIEFLPHVNTGVATIIVGGGENKIVVVPGANNYLTPNKVEKKADIIKYADIVLLQLEIPLETVIRTVEIAAAHEVPVILNPAPSTELPEGLFEKVSVFTPNEHELSGMFGNSNIRSRNPQQLMKLFPEKIIMTRGNKGAYFTDKKGHVVHVPSFPVDVVDTTGAGDSFNAGLAVMLSQGKSLFEATKFAVAVGALSVTKFGAQGGMPTYNEVVQFIKSRRD